MKRDVRRPVLSGGFTLVELLVVIGIISLLISILLPTLNRVRETARSAKCMNNMRQIALATINYANDNNGLMPGRAGTGALVFNGDVSQSWDWIAWQSPIDPVTGAPSTGANQNLTYSALAKYMGIAYRNHSTPQEAVAISNSYADYFICPSDDRLARANGADNGRNVYRYSYSMNWFYMNPVVTAVVRPPSQQRGITSFKKGERVDGIFTGKIHSIKAPSEKVLVVCEDEQTIEDGTFVADSWQYVNGQAINAVAARHENKRKRAASATVNNIGNEDSRGNVVFADGHGEFFTRKDALRRRYSGNPNYDFSGF